VNVFSVGNTLYAKGPFLDEGVELGNFSISDSYIFPSLPGYRLSDTPTPLDAGPFSGGWSGGFGLSNSYTPPSLAGYQPPYTLPNAGPSFGGGDGFWGDVQRFLQSLAGLNSLIDPYILTEQERMQLEVQRRLAEAERARAEAEARRASIQVQPAVPAWVWVAVVGLGVVALVLLLKE
jgi:hypothetical protein